MPLPHNALVLVADGRKMLFFRNHGDENQIDLRTESHDARRYQRKDRDIKTDAPGTVKQSFGFGHSTYEETDFQQQEEDRWIAESAAAAPAERRSTSAPARDASGRSESPASRHCATRERHRLRHNSASASARPGAR